MEMVTYKSKDQDRSGSLFGALHGGEKLIPLARVRSKSAITIPMIKRADKARSDLFCKIEDDPNYFFKMCQQGNVDKLDELLKDNSMLILRKRLTDGYTGLHVAAAKSRLNAIDFLISKGANINAKADNGNTPLHVAVEKGRIISVRHLLMLNADPSILNNDQMSALHLSVVLDQPDILEELLSHESVDIEICGPHGARPSHYACALSNPQCMSILMRHNCKICQSCELGYYPVHTAIRYGALETASYMLDHLGELPWGYSVADVLNFADKERNTPLHLAVNGGDLEAIQLCLSYGANVDSVQENKSTPFHFACAQGSLPIVRILYEAYLEQQSKNIEEKRERNLLDAKDCVDMTPLHRAAIYDHHGVVSYLIEQKASLNEVDRQNRTPLLVAVTGRSHRSANLLINGNAEIEVEDDERRNVLHYLVLHASTGPEFVQLIERIVLNPKGHNLLNNKDYTGCSPLHLASRAGNVKFTEVLLRLGATVRLKDKADQSPLHFAARYGRYNTVKRLLESPAGPNIINETDNSGATALHVASANGHAKTVQLLMCKGALMHKDYGHKTPLHLAVENGYPDVIQVLLAFHNNLLDSKCKKGGSPLHFAAVHNQPSCVEFLLSAGCKYCVNDALKTPLELAVEKKNVEAALAMVKHERWEEILTIYDPSSVSPVYLLIERMPEIYKVILDRSITRGNNRENSRKSDWEKYSFKFIESESCAKSPEEFSGQPLPVLNAMVKFGRKGLISHPVCLTYLNSKWLSYGFFIFFITMLFYSLFVLCLTATVLIWHDSVIYGSDNVTKLENVYKIYHIRIPLRLDSWIMLLYVFLYAVLNLIKEAICMFYHPRAYFADLTHYLQLVLYITSIIFAGHVLECSSTVLFNWRYGSVAVFLAWFHFVISLQRLNGVGLYIVMFRQILSTLLRVIFLFFGLFVAFGLTFYLLLWSEEGANFKTPFISIVQTVMCMMGEWNYVELFADPYFNGTLTYPVISFAFLIIFVTLMPILFINLMIGLAVGDIEMIQKNASLKRLAMQIEYFTEMEKIIPKKLLAKFASEEVVKYDGKYVQETGGLSAWQAIKAFLCNARMRKTTEEMRSHDHDSQKCSMEIEKARKNIELVNGKLDHLSDLLRLVVQKMEIQFESDYDFDKYIAGSINPCKSS